MKVVSYIATLPRKEQYISEESLKAATDKLNTLKFFVQYFCTYLLQKL